MRKKSHISLSRGILSGLGTETEIKHRYTFYIGSIVPDCMPSFLVKRHNVEQTFDIFVKNMEKFTTKFKVRGKNMDKLSFRSTLRMGIIMHYLADYFTFPHNAHYEGGFKEHCKYEGQQLKDMRKFVEKIRKAELKMELPPVMDNIKQIVDFVKTKHAEYVEDINTTTSDCRYSFQTCLCVAASLLAIANANEGALAI